MEGERKRGWRRSRLERGNESGLEGLVITHSLVEPTSSFQSAWLRKYTVQYKSTEILVLY